MRESDVNLPRGVGRDEWLAGRAEREKGRTRPRDALAAHAAIPDVAREPCPLTGARPA